MPYVTSPHGPRIHYRIVGHEGPTVMLIQGLGLSGDFWFDLPQRLATNDERPYRVIIPDNRGTGRSELPTRPFLMSHLADDLAAILAAEDIAQAYICGISLGGMVAQHFALNHAARVKGLLLMATTPGLPHGRLPPLRSMASLLTLPLVLKPGTQPRQLVNLMLPPSVQHRADELFAGWLDAVADNRIAPRTFLAQFLAGALHSTGRRLHEVRVPTEIVTGANDVVIQPTNSQVLARRIRDARLEVLAEVGHAIPVQDANVVHRALDRLIARVEGPGAARNARAA